MVARNCSIMSKAIIILNTDSWCSKYLRVYEEVRKSFFKSQEV